MQKGPLKWWQLSLVAIVGVINVTPAEAKSNQIPAPNLPWQKGEALVLEKKSNHRVGLTDHASFYTIYSDRLAKIMGQTTWRLVCDKDAMSDEINCMTIDDEAAFGVYYKDGNEQPVGVKIFEHDYPGETAMIRVGDEKPFTSDDQGWVFDPKLIEQIGKGGIVKTRVMIFPSKSYVDKATEKPVSGFDEAVSLMRHLKTNFGEISFDKPRH